MANPTEIQNLREDYRLASLDEGQCEADPMKQFEQWFQEAQRAALKEPNAMTLSTVSREGQPSGRIVLLKGIEQDALLFYTNYESRKGRELAANPRCALTFLWAELERQVRVEGLVEKVSRGVSEAYFKTRPKGSRLGALVSKQSAELSSREQLERRLAELEEAFGLTDEVPIPEAWGGYKVKPKVFEFWQGRRNRLHDRIIYRLGDTNRWVMGRLSP
jgi:pyridoxamine-phosphate oxidase